jgi:nucleotide-binding universal stress UspA family protein
LSPLPEKILLTTDGSEYAKLAARAAADLSDKESWSMGLARCLRLGSPSTTVLRAAGGSVQINPRAGI